MDVATQVRLGARYLDLEVTWNRNSGVTQLPQQWPGYYLSTGNFVSSNPLGEVMEQIRQFLSVTNEVLIVSVRLNTQQGAEDRLERRNVWNSFKDCFGKLLVDTEFVDSLQLKDPNAPDWLDTSWLFTIGLVTINDLWRRGSRLVIISGLADIRLQTGFIFPEEQMRWDDAKAYDTRTLLKFLDGTVMQPRPPKVNSQGCRMPDPLWFLGTHVKGVSDTFVYTGGFMYNELETEAEQTNPQVVERLGKDWRDKPLNIVAGDWIHQNGFCEALINHNTRRV